MLTSQPTRYRFGTFHLDAESGELRSNGRSVRLQPQPLQVLLELLRRPGRIVTREDFQASLWPGNTYVEFDVGLNQAIRRLRIALGDTAQIPGYIETIPRRGYRFVASVEVEGPTPVGPNAEPPTTPRTEKVPRRGRIIGLSIIGFAVAFGAFHLIRQQAPGSQIESLAVLPLANFSDDPDQEHFADAITEELTTELARIKSLRVISRTSAMKLKGTKLSLQEIGRELGVEAVVEGSVQRSSGRVRISAQLVRVEGERHLWAETYERGLNDVLGVRSEVSREIAARVRAEIAPREPAPTRGHTIDPAAYDSYLIGMRFFDETTLPGYEKSISYFEEATRKDANYALAYAQLAEAHAMIAYFHPSNSSHYEQARASARKAAELDPDLPETRIRDADLKFYWDWDWKQCEGAFRRAALEAPGSSDVQSHYATCLEVLGRYREALAYMQNAHRIDPLSTMTNTALGRLLARNGQTSKSFEYLNKARDLDPNNAYAYELLAWIYGHQNQQERAVEMQIKVGRLDGSLPEGSEKSLMTAFRNGGIAGFQLERSKFLKKHIERTQNDPDTSPVGIATLCVRSGDFDEAFRWLNKAYEQHSPLLVWLKSGIAWEPLRNDPRYQTLLSKMKMPQ